MKPSRFTEDQVIGILREQRPVWWSQLDRHVARVANFAPSLEMTSGCISF
jgi:hypothetical protein